MYQETENNFTRELKKDNSEYEDVDAAVKEQLRVEMPKANTVPLPKYNELVVSVKED